MTIDAGDGNDTVTSYGYSSISGGDGNDLISLKKQGQGYATMTGGKGDDTINLVFWENLIQYSGGDGKDVITGLNESDTIKLSNATLTGVSGSGDDVVLKFGTDSITVKDAKNKIINLQDTDDLSTPVFFNGTSTVNAVYNNNHTYDETLTGSDNADYIYNSYYANYSKIYAGAGNDTIVNKAHGSTIYPGSGNDLVILPEDRGHNSTIIYTGGNDTIKTDYGFRGTIDLTSIGASVKSFYTSPSGDITLEINKGSLTIQHNYGNSQEDFTVNMIVGDNYVTNRYVSGVAYNGVIGNTGTEGNDWINGYFNNEIIDADAGNDYMDISGSENSIIGGTGNDSIYLNGSENSIIIGGTGNDSLYIYGNDNLILYNLGDGNDTIINQNWNNYYYNTYSTNNSYSNVVSLTGGASVTGVSISDNLHFNINVGSNTLSLMRYYYYSDRSSWFRTTKGGTEIVLGNSFTDEEHKGALLEGTDGDDYIYNHNYKYWQDSITVDGSSKWYNYVSDGIYYRYIDHSIDDTIDAGKGNDIIYLNNASRGYNRRGHSDVIKYAAGDGKDTVIGYTNNNVIALTDGASISKLTRSGKNVILTIGDDTNTNSGSITLKEAKDEIINIQDEDGEINSFYFDGTSTMNAVYNNYRDELVTGSNKRDYIFNYSNGYYATLDSGAGDDIIVNYAWSASINAGAGNDVIYDLYYDPTTIKAGVGNDTMYLVWGDEIIQYESGDGNDVVSIDGGNGNYNYLTFDLAEGTTVTGFKKSGTDLIFNLTGGGSFTLKDVNTYNTIPKIAFRTISDGKQVNTHWIDGKVFNDVKINYSDESYVYEGTATGTDGNDFIGISTWYNDVTIDGGAGDDFIQNSQSVYSSINGGAGNDTIIAGNNYSDGWSSSFAGTTIDGGEGNDLIQTYTSASYRYYNRYDTLIGGWTWNEVEPQASINGGAGNDIIEAQMFSASVTGYWDWDDVNEIEFWNSGTDDLGTFGQNVTIQGGTGNDTIRNKFLYVRDNYTETFEYDEEDYQWKIADGYEDSEIIVSRTVKSYLNSAGNTYTSTTIYKFKDGSTKTETYTAKLIYNRLIQYANGDGNDVVEDYNVGDTLQIDGSYSTQNSGSDVIVKVGSGSIKLVGAKGKALNIVGGEFTTELGDVVLTNKDTTPYNAADTVAGIDATARTKAITINGNANDNTILGGSKNDILNGGDGADYLNGGAGADKLNGDNGNDSLQGGKGADTLTGGNGADVFFYTDGDGKDVITDYTSEDIIRLLGGNVNKTSVKGSDVYLVVGSGYMKLNGAKGQKVTLIDANGNTTRQMYGEKSIRIEDGDGKTVNTSLNTVAITLDASTRTEDLDLIANAKANVIKLGEGKTTVATGNGKDTVIASEYGEALITDYVSGQDKLKFKVDINDAQLSGSDVIFTIGEGIVTVQGAKGKKITVIDKDGVETSQIYGNSIVTVGNSDGATVKAIGGVKALDATKRTKAVTLIANDSGNTLNGGTKADVLKGGAGADSLTGGKGNDSLSGGSGADIFAYTKGDGNDVITDYRSSDGDIIRLGAKTAVTGVAISGNDMILTVGSGKLTLKGAANDTVTVVDANNIKMTYQQWTEKSFTEVFAENSIDEIFADDNVNTNDFNANALNANNLNEIISTNNLISGDYNFDSVQNKFTSNKITDLTHSTKK